MDGQLAGEVAHVCVNGIAYFQKHVDDVNICKLTEIARSRYGSSSNFEHCLNSLFKEAISDLNFKYMRDAATENFGLKGSGSYAKSLPVRQVNAALTYGGSGQKVAGSVYRQDDVYERALIVDVGRNIEALSKLPISRMDTWGEGERKDGDYVSRPSLESELGPLLGRGEIVAIVGEGGTGKSTLAKVFGAWKYGYESTIIIGAGNERTLLCDIRSELTRVGIETANLSDSEVTLRLRKFLAEGQRRPFLVILDNVVDWDLVKLFLPERLKVTVCITARSNLVKRSCSYVRVGSLTKMEVREMISQRLPDAPEEVVLRLTVLRGRALAVEQVCAYLRQQGDGKRLAYISMLEKNVARALDLAAMNLDEQALGSIYEETVEALRRARETRTAVLLLEFISFINSPKVGFSILQSCMQVAGTDREFVELLFRSVLDVLKRYHLVDEVNCNIVKVHALTLALLCEVFSDQVAVRSRQILTAVQEWWDSEVEKSARLSRGLAQIRGIYPASTMRKLSDEYQVTLFKLATSEGELIKIVEDVATRAYEATGDVFFEEELRRACKWREQFVPRQAILISIHPFETGQAKIFIPTERLWLKSIVAKIKQIALAGPEEDPLVLPFHLPNEQGN